MEADWRGTAAPEAACIAITINDTATACGAARAPVGAAGRQVWRGRRTGILYRVANTFPAVKIHRRRRLDELGLSGCRADSASPQSDCCHTNQRYREHGSQTCRFPSVLTHQHDSSPFSSCPKQNQMTQHPVTIRSDFLGRSCPRLLRQCSRRDRGRRYSVRLLANCNHTG